MQLRENATIDEIIDILAGNYKNYKCYDLLRDRLENIPEFREIIINGINTGKIRGFDKELWEKIWTRNLGERRIKVNTETTPDQIVTITNSEEIFENGYNIGSCQSTSKLIWFSIPHCYLCGGFLPILKGTYNCENGEHIWSISKTEIYDTSLMLIIDEEYAKKVVGYDETGYFASSTGKPHGNRYNPNDNSLYEMLKAGFEGRLK